MGEVATSSSRNLLASMFSLSRDELRAVLAPFAEPAGLPSDLLVGRTMAGPVDLVAGGPCLRHDLEGVTLNTAYQILVPLWVAAQLRVPAGVFLGVREESLVYPSAAGRYADLGRRLEEGIRRMADDYNVSVTVMNTADRATSEAIERTRLMLGISLTEEQSRWFYELRKGRNLAKPPHSAARVQSTARVVTCHTPHLLTAILGCFHPMIVEDVEQHAAVRCAETFIQPVRANHLAFLNLPDLRGAAPMFRASRSERVVLAGGGPAQVQEGSLPVDVQTLYRGLALMLPDGPGKCERSALRQTVTYLERCFLPLSRRQVGATGAKAMKQEDATMTGEEPTPAGSEEASPDGALPLLVEGSVVGRRLLSGLQPSGALHLGNYFGAMQQHIDGQIDNEGFFFIATYHAMTTIRDPTALARLTNEVALDYLAIGLDPARAALYRQTDLPEVTELAWILGCVSSMGDLDRAVSYKDKVSRGIVANVGLYTYPVLMAADILAVRAQVVPVGQDQVQHIEMARRFAFRFNRVFGRPIFVIPQAKVNDARIVPGIDGQKMSKSYGNAIPLFGEPAIVRKLVYSIRTDSSPIDAPKDPDACGVFAFLRLMASPQEAAQWAERYRAGGLRYADAKRRVVELYEERFGPARERRCELAAHPERVEEILREGARKARRVAKTVMEEVRDAVGIPRRPCS